MTKKRDIIKKIKSEAKAQGVSFEEREGGNHTILKVGGATVPVPRHNEIDNRTAIVIYGECPFRKDWWK